MTLIGCQLNGQKRNSFNSYQSMNFPFHAQLGKNDCGISCLSMLASFYKEDFHSIESLLHNEITPKGLSLLSIRIAAEKMGLIATSCKCDIDMIGRVSTPTIAFWNGNHFVVVYRVSTRYVWVADPAIGKVRYRKDEFQQGWYLPGEQAGVLLVMEPKPSVKRDKSI